MSVRQMQHKGKPYLYADFRGTTKEEEQLAILQQIIELAEAAPGAVSILSNFEGASVSGAFMAKAKDRGKERKAKVERQALVGITGLKKILMTGYITFTGQKAVRAFETDAEALDWIVGG